MRPVYTLSFIVCMLFFQLVAVAQTNIFPPTGSAGIGTRTPDTSALLEMKSTKKGLLIPRMLKTQRDAIFAPAAGLMIYQTNSTPGFYYYDGSAWKAVSAKSQWTTSGSDIYYNTGNVGIGTSTPGSKLSIQLSGNDFFGFESNNGTVSIKTYQDNAYGQIGTYSNHPFQLMANNGINQFVLLPNGNVGIGTGIPNGKLDVAGGDAYINGVRVGLGGGNIGSNTVVGNAAMMNNTTGSSNIALGVSALFSNTTGSTNIAIGNAALYTGNKSYLIAIGDSALFNNGKNSQFFQGISNVAIGSKALFANTTGSGNTAVGRSSLSDNVSGYNNTALGVSSLSDNTSGYSNTALGSLSLSFNNTGNENTAVGDNSLGLNTSGNTNTAFGRSTLFKNTTGNSNVAMGANALYSNTVNSNLVAIGDSALYFNGVGSNFSYNGSENVAVGSKTLYNNNIGYKNTGVGQKVLYNNTNGNSNTAIGGIALFTNTTGSLNTALGYFADVTSGSLVNTTAIGYGAKVNAGNKVVVGNTSVTVIGGQVGWSVLSDARFKKDIKQDVPGLAFINKLKPVTYHIEVEKFEKFLGTRDSAMQQMKAGIKGNEQKLRTGLIAQEVEKAAKEIKYDFDGVNAPQNDKDNYSLVYAGFVPSLIKSVQELSSENEKLKSKNEEQQKINQDLQQQINELKAMIVSGQSTGNSYQSTNNNQLSATISSASLSQNIPNPFSNTTIINYTLPAGYSSAKIIITDKKGSVLKQANLSAPGSASLKVDAATMAAGAYQYSLYINDKLVDTKQMVLIK